MCQTKEKKIQNTRFGSTEVDYVFFVGGGGGGRNLLSPKKMQTEGTSKSQGTMWHKTPPFFPFPTSNLTQKSHHPSTPTLLQLLFDTKVHFTLVRNTLQFREHKWGFIHTRNKGIVILKSDQRQVLLIEVSSLTWSCRAKWDRKSCDFHVRSVWT